MSHWRRPTAGNGWLSCSRRPAMTCISRIRWTRAIAAARVKTDAIDARTLAQLLRAGMLPEAYVAPREMRDLRELLRHRATLTRMRSAVKNRVHAIPAKHGVIHQPADLFAKAGRRFLAALELRDAP